MKVSGCGLVEGNFSVKLIIFSDEIHFCTKLVLSLAKHTKLLMPDGTQQQSIRGCQVHTWHEEMRLTTVHLVVHRKGYCRYNVL